MDAIHKLELIIQRVSDFALFNQRSERLTVALSKVKILSHDLVAQEAKVKISTQDADDEYRKYIILLNSKPNLKYNELSYRQYKYIALSPLLLKSEHPFVYFLRLLKTHEVLNQKSLLNIFINYSLNYDSLNNNSLPKVKLALQELFETLKTLDRVRTIFYPFNERGMLLADNPVKEILKYLLELLNQNKQNSVMIINEFFSLGFGDLYSSVIYDYFKMLLIDYNKNKEIIYNQFLSNHRLNKVILSKMVSDLILIVRNNVITDKSLLISKILNLKKDNIPVFGDPRLRPDQWELVDLTAVQIFRSWLNHKNIEFFFGVIFENRDTAADRRDFWLRYVNHIIDIKFFIAEVHKRRSIIKFKEAQIEMGLNFGSTDTDASLFIMEFEHFYIIEASTSGALALRIYSKHKQFGYAFLKMSDIMLGAKVRLSTFRGDDALEITSERMAEVADITKINSFKIPHAANAWRKIVYIFLKNYGIRAER